MEWSDFNNGIAADYGLNRFIYKIYIYYYFWEIEMGMQIYTILTEINNKDKENNNKKNRE